MILQLILALSCVRAYNAQTFFSASAYRATDIRDTHQETCSGGYRYTRAYLHGSTSSSCTSTACDQDKDVYTYIDYELSSSQYLHSTSLSCTTRFYRVRVLSTNVVDAVGKPVYDNTSYLEYTTDNGAMVPQVRPLVRFVRVEAHAFGDYCRGYAFCNRWFMTLRSAPTQCFPGFYAYAPLASSTDRECAACPAGKLTTVNNLADCHSPSPCPPGSAPSQNATASSDTRCSSCPTGTYSSTSDFAPCKPLSTCTEHQILSKAGSRTADTFCINKTTCSPGLYAVDNSQGRTCQACLFDSFTDKDNQFSCTSWRTCAAGSYVSVHGTASQDRQCAACPEGKFSDITNVAACRSKRTCGSSDTVIAHGSTRDDECCSTTSTWKISSWRRPTPGPSCGRLTLERDVSCPAHVCGGTCPGQAPVSVNTTFVCCQPCADDQYETQSCNAATSQQRVCRDATPPCYTPVGDADELKREFETQPLTTTSDRACKHAALCDPGEFVRTPPTRTSDRLCEACPAGTFRAEHAHTMRSCKPHSRCTTTACTVAVNGTATADAILGQVTTTSRSQDRTTTDRTTPPQTQDSETDSSTTSESATFPVWAGILLVLLVVVAIVALLLLYRSNRNQRVAASIPISHVGTSSSQPPEYKRRNIANTAAASHRPNHHRYIPEDGDTKVLASTSDM
eukprot:m.223952 g.223952  ORF g.223952 m.223952 type:complete len:679 (+) comp17277_c0_seq4:1641-3677(+)